MDEESQRAEMNAAIRAQRERRAVPRSMLPPDEDSPPPPARPAVEADPGASEPAQPKRGLLGRLLGR